MRQVSSCTSAAVLNVLHLCGVECRRWLWVTVCTPPKNSSVSLQKSPPVFEGFSQVHMNFKVSRVQRETLKTELHQLMFIEISLAEEKNSIWLHMKCQYYQTRVGLEHLQNTLKILHIQNVTCMCLFMTHRFLGCFFPWWCSDYATLAGYWHSNSTRRSCWWANWSQWIAENFICFMQYKVSFRLYGVVSPITSLLWGHSRMSWLSLCPWYRLTLIHTGRMGFRLFQSFIRGGFGSAVPWEIFVLLCLSASPRRQGELSLILHNPLCWFSSNTNHLSFFGLSSVSKYHSHVSSSESWYKQHRASL